MDKMLKEYLDKCEEEQIIPTRDGYILHLTVNKDYNYTNSLNEANKGKGLLHAHAKSFLYKKISLGGRNSGNYVQLLKQLQDEFKDEVLESVSDDDIKVIVQSTEKEV